MINHLNERRTENLPPEQSNITIVSLDLSPYVGSEVHEKVVDAARCELCHNLSHKRLRGTWVQGFGSDLHLHVTTYNKDFMVGDAYVMHPSEIAVQAAHQAGHAGCRRTLGAINRCRQCYRQVGALAARPKGIASLALRPGHKISPININ